MHSGEWLKTAGETRRYATNQLDEKNNRTPLKRELCDSVPTSLTLMPVEGRRKTREWQSQSSNEDEMRQMHVDMSTRCSLRFDPIYIYIYRKVVSNSGSRATAEKSKQKPIKLYYLNVKCFNNMSIVLNGNQRVKRFRTLIQPTNRLYTYPLYLAMARGRLSARHPTQW